VSRIRVGIGGWNFAPWRKIFYPDDLPQARELHYASRHVTSIEINSTFYRTQSPQSYRRWADETPDDFVFSLKAHRVVTHRKLLVEAGPAIENFMASGLSELKDKLGPIVWQFAPTKKFEPDDFEAFLAMLPSEFEGRRQRHVVEVRHDSFCTAEFIDLARSYSVAICIADSQKYPLIADLTADFVYARLQSSSDDYETGYSSAALDLWTKRAKSWAAGAMPEDLPSLSDKPAPHAASRDCFIYFIAGAKHRNPTAAQAMIERVA
jgi:uncharacterized protein YecE (DUF72 family)